jgi:hypothetical protein
MAWPGATIPEGTTILTKLLQVDLPITWDSFDKLGDIDGNEIRVGKFTSKYNALTNVGGRGTVTIVRQGTSEFSGRDRKHQVEPRGWQPLECHHPPNMRWVVRRRMPHS